jgi:ATP-binding cassette subfamily B protein
MVRILWRLLGYWRPYGLAVALAFASVFGGLAFTLATPGVIRYAIDSGISGGEQRALFVSAGLILVLQIGRGICGYLMVYVGEYLSQCGALDLRNQLYARIQSLSFSFHDNAQTGQLMSRATADVENARGWLDTGLTRLVLTFTQFVAVTVLMLALSWQLAILVMLTLPVVSWISFSTVIKLRPILSAVQQQMGAYAAVLQESLAGIRVVKAFNAERHELDRFQQANRAVRDKSLESARLSAFRQPMLLFSLESLKVAIIVYGGSLVIDNHLTLGTLFAFTQYREQLVQPVREIGQRMTNAARAAAAAERIFEVLDTASDVVDRPGATRMTGVTGHVVYQGVSFNYGRNFPTLKDVSFEARPGETIAIVGSTGSGKTTLVNLLPRFYDVSAGAITIDGQDIRDVTLASLRANVGVVMQDVFLFSATIRENIAYGRPEASEEDIVSAAKSARLHDFILTLPDGYETWVGARGVTLSGGQKQRLAIARTVLLDPPILALDDSTSSVDIETEHLIHTALSELLENRTVFVVAHRMQTVRNADQIIVMRDGTIAERGRHDELIARDGPYRQIYETQFDVDEAVPGPMAQGESREGVAL